MGLMMNRLAIVALGDLFAWMMILIDLENVCLGKFCLVALVRVAFGLIKKHSFGAMVLGDWMIT